MKRLLVGIITPMSEALISQIDDFRSRNHMRSRSQAIRELIRRGLEAEQQVARGGLISRSAFYFPRT